MSKDRLAQLWDKLKSNKDLVEKLDLVEEVINEPCASTSKRKNSVLSSPLKLKKFKKHPDGKVMESDSSSLVPRESGSNDKIGQNDGASNSGDSTLSAVVEDTLQDNSDDEGMTNLERLLCEENNEDVDNAVEIDSEDFNFLGAAAPASWKPSPKTLKLFLNVADIELNKDIIDKIKEDFKTDSDIETHFEPPRFPTSLWSSIKNSPADVYKLKSLFKCQENLFLAIKPLLASLEVCPKECQDNIIKSIQLICTSNLTLNRFRRATIAPSIKPELRKEILSLPISHNSFFGEDFSKASDSIIKEQSSLEKIIHKPRKFQKPHSFQNQNFQVKSSFRGKPRGRFQRSRVGMYRSFGIGFGWPKLRPFSQSFGFSRI